MYFFSLIFSSEMASYLPQLVLWYRAQPVQIYRCGKPECFSTCQRMGNKAGAWGKVEKRVDEKIEIKNVLPFGILFRPELLKKTKNDLLGAVFPVSAISLGMLSGFSSSSSSFYFFKFHIKIHEQLELMLRACSG